MTHRHCDQLDLYIAGELDAAECRAFEAHLDVCDACEHQVRLQRRIDEVLERAIDPDDALPAALIELVERELLLTPRVAPLARTRRRIAVPLAVAATVTILLTAWIATLVVMSRSSTRSAGTGAQPAGDPSGAAADSGSTSAAAGPAFVAHVAFSKDTPMIAVPRESTDPDITIVWAYPVTPSSRAGASDTPPDQPSDDSTDAADNPTSWLDGRQHSARSSEA